MLVDAMVALWDVELVVWKVVQWVVVMDAY